MIATAIYLHTFLETTMEIKFRQVTGTKTRQCSENNQAAGAMEAMRKPI